MVSFARGSNTIRTQSMFRLPPCMRVIGIRCRFSPPSTPPRRFLRAPAKKPPQKPRTSNAQDSNGKAIVKPPTEAPLKGPAGHIPVAQPSPLQQANAVAWRQREDLIRQLSTGGQQRVLFRSTKHRGYLARIYLLATAAFGCAVWNFDVNYLNLEKGYPSWVSVGYGVMSIILAGIGIAIVAIPSGLVKTITAVPKGLRTRPYLVLRIEGVRTSPLPAKTVEAQLADCIVSSPAGQQSQEVKVAIWNQAEARRIRPTDPVMLRPFLWLGKVVSRIAFKWHLKNKQMFTGDQLAQLNVRDHGKWKVDVNGSFPNGEQTFDMLIRTR